RSMMREPAFSRFFPLTRTGFAPVAADLENGCASALVHREAASTIDTRLAIQIGAHGILPVLLTKFEVGSHDR
ncbi:hypothetical protein, partial [Escherichia coli]|uniref:hypothetical protein n=1 Tax=Escherichia coli TaxID=562 RepID=UPI0019D67A47